MLPYFINCISGAYNADLESSEFFPLMNRSALSS